MATTIYYKREKHETLYKLNTVFKPDEGTLIAKEAAEDYHGNHDGWEDSWPITFTLYDSDKKEAGRYKVELEYSPGFYAEEIR